MDDKSDDLVVFKDLPAPGKYGLDDPREYICEAYHTSDGTVVVRSGFVEPEPHDPSRVTHIKLGDPMPPDIEHKLK